MILKQYENARRRKLMIPIKTETSRKVYYEALNTVS
jgi:hypothetical protein